MLHVICTRLRPDHLSACAGDSSRRSEEIIEKKSLESRLSMHLLLLSSLFCATCMNANNLCPNSVSYLVTGVLYLSYIFVVDMSGCILAVVKTARCLLLPMCFFAETLAFPLAAFIPTTTNTLLIVILMMEINYVHGVLVISIPSCIC